MIGMYKGELIQLDLTVFSSSDSSTLQTFLQSFLNLSSIHSITVNLKMPSAAKIGTSYPKPLQLTGALDNFSFEDLTPATGREYPTVNVVDNIINAPNSDELIRDLGITSMSPYLAT